MTELVVLSGKGGTGKTSISACLAVLSNNAIIADCDVDAANLHLLLNPKIQERYSFIGGIKASIDQNKCLKCGKCLKNCRFGAIKDYVIDTISCEGCAVCYYTCPAKAISINDHVSGEYYLSKTNYGTMVHGRLGIAEGNSGKLVAEIKKLAHQQKNEDTEFLIVDGPPGIGCPVVSTLSGANLALVVTEPTLSGIHDLDRALDLINQLRVKPLVCINKVDINQKNVKKIEEVCLKHKAQIIGKVSYSRAFINAVNNNKTLLEYDKDCEAAIQIKELWSSIKNLK